MKKQSKREKLYQSIRRLHLAGAQCANICYNMKQKLDYRLTRHDCEIMGQAQKQYDEACIEIGAAMREYAAKGREAAKENQ